MFLAGSKACQMLLDDIESTNSIRVLTILISLQVELFQSKKFCSQYVSGQLILSLLLASKKNR